MQSALIRITPIWHYSNLSACKHKHACRTNVSQSLAKQISFSKSRFPSVKYFIEYERLKLVQLAMASECIVETSVHSRAVYFAAIARQTTGTD